jgi:hypothetical protein
MKAINRIRPAILLCVLATGPATSLVFGQVDFSGSWNPLYHEDFPERIHGAEPADYAGLPINAAARARADADDADRISVVMEYQCRPHGSDYSMRGSANLRITKDIDADSEQNRAFKTHIGWMGMERTIWLDNRPHPPEMAVHTWQGFSTGVWEGNMLTITTTHLKPSYMRRNGVPRSDKAKVTEHWTRHGNFLTVVVFVDDPVFLAEPLIRSENWILDPGQDFLPQSCEPAPEVPAPKGTVPQHLPGTNPFLHEVADRYGLPYKAVRGGPETMYPEFRQTMGKPEKPVPEKCDRYCACGMNAGACDIR